MDKFTKIFEADMKNSIDKLEEAEVEKKKRKAGGKLALGMLGGAAVGANVPLVRAAHKTTKSRHRIRQIMTKHPKLGAEIMEKLARNVGKAGTTGAIAGGAATLGTMALRNRKKKVSESALEEGIAGVAANALAKLKGLKPVKQAKNVVKDIKDVGRGAIPGYKYLLSAPGETKAGAAKKIAGRAGKYLGASAKANPFGAALVGGGGAGVAGLTAWGLKKPKKVQEAAPFDFSKLKGKDEGKDEGKDKATAALEKAKAKKKGDKDDKKGLPDFFKKKGEDKSEDEKGMSAMEKMKKMKEMHGKMKDGGMKDEKDMGAMEKMKKMKEKGE